MDGGGGQELEHDRVAAELRPVPVGGNSTGDGQAMLCDEVRARRGTLESYMGEVVSRGRCMPRWWSTDLVENDADVIR